MGKITEFHADGTKKETYINNTLTLHKGGNMNITPLYDRILIKPFEPEQYTAGGIIIPDTARESSVKGEVVATGEGRVVQDGSLTPLKVKVGDIVIYSKNKFDASNLLIDGQEYIVMRETDIIGIVN
jgi:chaperonin GroES